MSTSTSTIVGQGWLSWPRSERVGDRYGAVGLLGRETRGKDGKEDIRAYFIDSPPEVGLAEGLKGHGRLVAVVTANGVSGHIGDLFRGFAPPRTPEDAPAIGSRHQLGEGTLFYDKCHGWTLVGLCPEDGRDTDWLDPETLYLLHEQEVILTFETSP